MITDVLSVDANTTAVEHSGGACATQVTLPVYSSEPPVCPGRRSTARAYELLMSCLVQLDQAEKGSRHLDPGKGARFPGEGAHFLDVEV